MSSTLQSFIMGLSHQIPSSKLQTMSSSHGNSSNSKASSVQRLFLERSTEALPMGSKIRNAVGSNFEEALRLLQKEIDNRLKESKNETSNNAKGSKKTQKKRGAKDTPHKYPIMAFARDSYHTADNHTSADNKKLKLCSDCASSSDFLLLQDTNKDALSSYKHAILYARYDKSFILDHHAFLCAFLEQLQTNDDHDDASDATTTTLENTEKSIRQFLSCLVTNDDILADAAVASKVGELLGRYALVCFKLRSVSCEVDGGNETLMVVTNAISMTLSLVSSSVESIASYVAGYIQYAIDEIKDDKSKSTQHIFVNTTVALGRALMQCNKTTLPNLQSLERNKKTAIQFNDAKKEMNNLMTWANEHTIDQENSSDSQSDENQEGDEDSEVKDESVEEDENQIESIIDDALLRRSTRNKSV